jgi:hypothetical protein
MKVKVFQTSGGQRIAELEERINFWLEATRGLEVKHTNTALCSVAETGDGERYQSTIITIWYDRA